MRKTRKNNSRVETTYPGVQLLSVGKKNNSRPETTYPGVQLLSVGPGRKNYSTASGLQLPLRNMMIEPGKKFIVDDGIQKMALFV